MTAVALGELEPDAPRSPWRERAKRFYEAHEPACTAGLFVAGFLFDTLAVGRIDKVYNIIHQNWMVGAVFAFLLSSMFFSGMAVLLVLLMLSLLFNF